jgi:hypothetical protein
MRSRRDVDKFLHLVSPRRVGVIVFLVLLSTAYVGGSLETAAPFAPLLDAAAQTNGDVSLPRLHVEGNQIKDERGQSFILRGVNKPQFGWSVVGNWPKIGGNYSSGNKDFNIDDVSTHLRAMKSLGCNVVRTFIRLKWWKEPQVWWWSKRFDYRQLIKNTIQAAGEQGLYVLVACNSIDESGQLPPGGLPYPPYTDAEQTKIIPSREDFVNLIVSIAKELEGYTNVLISPWNEPFGNANRAEWAAAVQDCANQIRSAGISNIIVVEWFAHKPSGGLDYDFSFFRTNPILGTNIVYDIHMYRQGFLDKPYAYTDLKNRLHAEQIDVATVPLIVGECGVDRWATGQEYQNELTYLTNLLKVLNEWRIGYAAYAWQNERPPDDPLEAGEFAVLKDEPAIPTLADAGRILMNSIQGDTTSTITTTLQTTTATTPSTTSTTPTSATSTWTATTTSVSTTTTASASATVSTTTSTTPTTVSSTTTSTITSTTLPSTTTSSITTASQTTTPFTTSTTTASATSTTTTTSSVTTSTTTTTPQKTTTASTTATTKTTMTASQTSATTLQTTVSTTLTVATTSYSTSHQTITSTQSSGTVPSTYTNRETLRSTVTSLLTRTSTSTGTYASTTTQLSKTGTAIINQTLTSTATSGNTVYVDIVVHNTLIEQFLERVSSAITNWIGELTEIIQNIFVNERVTETVIQIEPSLSSTTITLSTTSPTTTSLTTTSSASTSVFTYAWSTLTATATSYSTSHQTITSTQSSGTVPSTYTSRETLYSVATSLLTRTSTSTGISTSVATELSRTGTETLNHTLTSLATSSNTVYVRIIVEKTFIEQFLSKIVSAVVDWLTELTQIIHNVFVTETVRDTIVRVEPTAYSSTTTLATFSTTAVSSTSTTTTSATASTTVMSSTSSLSTSRSTTTTVATSSLTSYQATTSTQGTGAKGAPRFVLDVSPKPGYAGKPVTISGVMYGSWRCIRDGVVVSKSVEIATGWGFKATVTVGADGRFSVVATGPSNGGAYSVTATFYEDQDLAGNSATVTYQVSQFVETVLSLGHRSVADNSGNGRLFSGYLKEKNGGKPVADKTIKLTIVSGGSAMTFTLETNSQGYYEYKFNGNGGLFTSATASFAGDNTFLPSTAKVGYSNSSPSGSTLPNGENYVYSTNQTKSGIVGFTNIQSCLDSYNPNVYVISGVNHGNICLAAASTAEKGTVRFVLDVSPKPGYAGKSVTISGVMYGSWRCIRDGVVVTKPVEITTGWGFKATVTVGADGRFSVVATGPSTGGSYAVTVTFYEDQDLAGSSATVNYQVVQYVETVLSLGHRSVADNSGNGRLFSGYLKEKNGGKPVAGKTIRLTIVSGGSAMTFTLETNSQGYYEYKFNGNGGIFTSATASFAGDNTFLPSTAKVAG